MRELKDKLIVALDVDSLEKAKEIVEKLLPTVNIFKVGNFLYPLYGPDIVKYIHSKGGHVFLDLKFHDIPNTVYYAVSTSTNINAVLLKQDNNIEEKCKKATDLGVFMMTVHTKGGSEMLKAAVRGAAEKAEKLKIPRPLIVGVTRLTSDEDQGNIQVQVLEAARLAKEAGLDGVVCAVSEVAMIRKEFGKDFIIVTAGIRPKNYPADDQKRTATAQDAIAAGADFIVVGRPILEASDPLKAAKELL